MDFAKWEEQLSRGDLQKGWGQIIHKDTDVGNSKVHECRRSRPLMIARIWGWAEGKGSRNEEVHEASLVGALLGYANRFVFQQDQSVDKVEENIKFLSILFRLESLRHRDRNNSKPY